MVIEDTHVKVILHMSSYCCYDKIIGHNNSDDFQNVEEHFGLQKLHEFFEFEMESKALLNSTKPIRMF